MPEVVIIDDSSSEEEQQSKPKKSNPIAPPPRSSASASANNTPEPHPATAASNSLNLSAQTISASPLLFDRLAMERERLARQKRLRPDVTAPAASSDDEDESQEVEKKDEAGEERDAKRRKLNGPADAGPSVSRPVQRDVPVVPQSTGPSRNELFLEGEVRPTWISIAPNDTRKRFKIQDVIGDVSLPQSAFRSQSDQSHRKTT